MNYNQLDPGMTLIVTCTARVILGPTATLDFVHVSGQNGEIYQLATSGVVEYPYRDTNQYTVDLISTDIAKPEFIYRLQITGKMVIYTYI